MGLCKKGREGKRGEERGREGKRGEERLREGKRGILFSTIVLDVKSGIILELIIHYEK